MNPLTRLLGHLKRARKDLQDQVARYTQQIDAITRAENALNGTPKRRGPSAEGRKRIAAAQRRRHRLARKGKRRGRSAATLTAILALLLGAGPALANSNDFPGVQIPITCNDAGFLQVVPKGKRMKKTLTIGKHTLKVEVHSCNWWLTNATCWSQFAFLPVDPECAANCQQKDSAEAREKCFQKDCGGLIDPEPEYFDTSCYRDPSDGGGFPN